MIFRYEKYLEDIPKPIIDTEKVYLESDIFPQGLPEHGNMETKKRKTEEEKQFLELHKNPVSTPQPKELEQMSVL